MISVGVALLALVGLVAWLSEEGRSAPLAPTPVAGAELAAGNAAVSEVATTAESAGDRLEAEEAALPAAASGSPEPLPFRREDIYGTVLDRTSGLPIASAIVTVFADPGWEATSYQASAPPELFEEVKADQQGRFRVGGVGAFASREVVVTADGYESLGTILESGRSHRVLLAAGLTLAGRVVRAPGHEPAPGIDVWVEREGSVWDVLGLETSRSDAEGRFQLERVPASQKVVLLFGEENRFPESFTLLTGSTPIEGIELRLGRASELRLRAVDLESGVPLPALSGRIVHIGAFRTDAAGLFAVRHDAERLPSTNGGILIEVEPDQACRTRILVALDELEEPHDVPISRGSILAGRVSDVAGRPIAGAKVHLPGPEPIPESPQAVLADLPPGVSVFSTRHRIVVTDEKGGFRLERLFPDVRRPGASTSDLQVSANGWRRRVLSVEIPPPGTSRWIDVVLDQGATVRGRVLQTGAPLAGVFVSAAPAEPRETRQCETNDGGEYECSSLPPGPATLTVRTSGWDSVTLAEIQVTLKSGEILEQDIQVEDVASRRLPIEGTVRDEQGNPLSNILVMTRGEGAPRAAKRSDAEGRFLLLVPPEPAQLEVVAIRKDHEAAATVAPGARDVELVLPVLGSLRLSVTGREGLALTDLSEVLWLPAGAPEETVPTGHRHNLVAGADGSFELQLAVGRWDFELRAPYHAPARLAGVEVRVDERAEHSVTLRSGATIELRFEPDGPRPPEAMLYLMTAVEKARIENGDPFTSLFVGARPFLPQPDGALVSSGYGAGPHLLSGIPQGWSLEPERFDVPDVERHRVLLRWTKLAEAR